LALVCFAAAAARADTQAVSIYPLSSLPAGARTVEMGFDADGSPSQMIVDASGDSQGSGSFLRLRRLVVSRDAAGAAPFPALLSRSAPWPADGVLSITATPVDASGVTGAPLTQSFDPRDSPPAVGSGGVSLRADLAGGALVITVPYSGPV